VPWFADERNLRFRARGMRRHASPRYYPSKLGFRGMTPSAPAVSRRHWLRDIACPPIRQRRSLPRAHRFSRRAVALGAIWARRADSRTPRPVLPTQNNHPTGGNTWSGYGESNPGSQLGNLPRACCGDGRIRCFPWSGHVSSCCPVRPISRDFAELWHGYGTRAPRSFQVRTQAGYDWFVGATHGSVVCGVGQKA
jgi:hypothetical protein